MAEPAKSPLSRRGALPIIGGMSASEPPPPAEPTDLPRPLPEAARRALAEAEARRAAAREAAPKEYGGRKGPDPVRYGDWEVKGLACDF